ncbi:hypothetical protein ATK74_0852 [Propionicimonas paludicola]|uniref:Uncharacterized protein n=1 Tax=Propionicimonas paludicola TaxID=185243 RepID=A0A2A9CPP9_9ACTN|nr:hypothetical protein [Propionicimonas paludicola]PFG16318.1 hypothetical protein ATK74_0852 [Propionicimonas paludicola]
MVAWELATIVTRGICVLVLLAAGYVAGSIVWARFAARSSR